MSIKIENLIKDLIKIPLNFRTLIPEYFNTYDIDSLGLTHTNIYTDIQLLIDDLSKIFTTIFTNYSNLVKKIPKQIRGRYNMSLKHLKLLVSNIEKIKYGLDQLKHTIFKNTDNEVIDFIDSIEVKQVTDEKTGKLIPDKHTITFKTYLKENIELYQAYYDTIYIYIFINIIKKFNINIFEKLIFKIVNKYLLICRQAIYKYQLYKENKSKVDENSKYLISLLANKNISLTELYSEIIENPHDYNIIIKSKINLYKTKLETDKKITLPKFYTKDIKDSILKKTFGLCNFDLYNVLTNSNLKMCYSNKSFLTLYNDIRINLRGSDNTRDNAAPLKLIENIFITTNNYIKLYSDFLSKGYFIETNYDNDIYFSRDAIIDIEFSLKEYNELDKTIENCKNRYVFIYCSQIPFNQKGFDTITKNIKGGHKVSLLIDKEKKEILFFDPFGMQEYNIYNNCVNIDIPIIYTILALELSKNLNSLQNYKFLYSAENVSPQETEHTEQMDKLYNYNMQQIFTQSGKKLRDWAGGYCGLWNYLYIFLLVINPHLDLSNIYTFFYKITTLDYNSMFCKLLIRNFAYYIENSLLHADFVIPLANLDMEQLDNQKIQRIKFNSNLNVIELRNMENNNYYVKKDINTTNNGDFTIDDLKFHKRLSSVTKNITVAKNILKIVKDFSKYIYSTGKKTNTKQTSEHKHAVAPEQAVTKLYTIDKINFITF